MFVHLIRSRISPVAVDAERHFAAVVDRRARRQIEIDSPSAVTGPNRSTVPSLHSARCPYVGDGAADDVLERRRVALPDGADGGDRPARLLLAVDVLRSAVQQRDDQDARPPVLRAAVRPPASSPFRRLCSRSTLAPGVEYVLAAASEPDLFVIKKQHRSESQETTPLAYYYILSGTVYQAPDLHSAIRAKLGRPSDGDRHLGVRREGPRGASFCWRRASAASPRRSIRARPPQRSERRTPLRGEGRMTAARLQVRGGEEEVREPAGVGEDEDGDGRRQRRARQVSVPGLAVPNPLLSLPQLPDGPRLRGAHGPVPRSFDEPVHGDGGRGEEAGLEGQSVRRRRGQVRTLTGGRFRETVRAPSDVVLKAPLTFL